MRGMLATLLVSASCAAAQDTLSCVSCGQGRYLSQQTRVCTDCPPYSSTAELLNGTDIENCRCIRGRFNDTHSCHECVRGEFKTGAGDVPCTHCHPHANTSLPGSFNATDCVCDPGHYESGPIVCAACAAGDFKSEPGNAACSRCPAHSFCVLGSVLPVLCPAHSTSAAGSVQLSACHCVPGFSRDAEYECQLCGPGKYQPLSNQEACVDCPQHTFLPLWGAVSDGECQACDANAHSAQPGATTRDACLCNTGFAGIPGAPCVACEPGAVRANLSEYICSACAVDSYNEYDAATECMQCPGNTSTAGLRRRAGPLACVCDAGFASARGLGAPAFECAACTPGTFQPDRNATRCEHCVPGSYATERVATSPDVCLECAHGKFTTNAAQTVCVSCPGDTWQNLTVLGVKASVCSACPAHSTHSSSGVTSVDVCTCGAGFVGTGVGPAYHCAPCEAGSFCPGNRTQTPCPLHAWSAAGRAACTPCAALSATAPGSPQHRQQECQCVAGAEGSFNANCTLCSPGTVRDDFASGPALCSPCTPDTYVAEPGQTACSACPANANAPPGSDSQADCVCDAAYYGPVGGPCALCLPGYYCMGGTTANPCMANAQSADGSSRITNCTCRAGHYSIAPGATCLACTVDYFCPGFVHRYACPGNSTSAWLADAVDKCVCDPGFWRGCTANASGFYDEHSRPCVVEHSRPCVACGANSFCLNNTHTHCPTHSQAPPGSSDVDHCVCDGGFAEQHHARHID